MRHRSLIVALLAVPFFALAAQAATTFRDIPAGNVAAKTAPVLADAKIMPGRTPVDFAGDAILTRYELAHILSALYVNPAPPGVFTVLRDVPPGHYATSEVERVLGYNLMAPLKNDEFGGDLAVSRASAVIALDNLLQRDGVEPPSRRDHPAVFTDVSAKSPLGAALERIVNRYQVLDAPSSSRFNPTAGMSRYDMLGMLVKAMPYFSAQVTSELKDATAPTPAPSLSPGETAAPPTAAPATPAPSEVATVPSAAPSAAASGAPASPAPEVSGAPASAAPPATPAPVELAFPTVPILRSHAWGGPEAILNFSEKLPTAAGATAAGEQSDVSGSLLGGGYLGVDYWGDRLGLSGSILGYFLPLEIPYRTQTVKENFADMFFRAAGYYKITGGPDWEAAVGLAGLIRESYNISGNIVDLTYLAADKFYLGGGPAIAYGTRLAPDITVTSALAIYPAVVQFYTLNSQSETLMRWGADANLRGEWGFVGPWYGWGEGQLYVSGAFSGGVQSVLGASVGVGMRY